MSCSFILFSPQETMLRSQVEGDDRKWHICSWRWGWGRWIRQRFCNTRPNSFKELSGAAFCEIFFSYRTETCWLMCPLSICDIASCISFYALLVRTKDFFYSHAVLNDWEGSTYLVSPWFAYTFDISCWLLESALLNVLTSRVRSCWDESCGKGLAIYS